MCFHLKAILINKIPWVHRVSKCLNELSDSVSHNVKSVQIREKTDQKNSVFEHF